MATIRKKDGRDNQWHVQIRRKHVIATKTFTKKTDAEQWAREVETEIDRGVYVSRAEAESTSLADACERYSREVLPNLKGKASDESRIKTIKEKLGRLPLAAVNSTVLSRFRDERLKEVGLQSVIHELGLISRVLKACVLDWGIALPGGVPQVRKPSPPPGRNRRISDDEIQAVINATESDQLPRLVGLALETAARRSELAALKWVNVDLKKNLIRLEDTKNGETRVVPLSPAAQAILKEVPRRIDGRVFGLSPDSITQSFERAVKRARKEYELECLSMSADSDRYYLIDLNFHDLRHEATSRIAKKVPNLIELASITGHKDLQMLKRYYHPDPEELVKKLAIV
ncbi:site-specific integrase [Methylovorus mays]|uniref:site-specific integrase n=1 Tax=Methylovorus mays TaxID=184077 RepID=UPI001E3BEE55|nr:site-specific integrase [Methylovorus mays]MCB5207808.1 site-specific integrase [Methylovorus mays]